MSGSRRFYLLPVFAGLVLLAATVACNETEPRVPPSRPGTGTVLGRLNFTSDRSAPYNAQDLYLGNLIPAGVPDASPAVSFSYDTNPHTAVHAADGTFAFVNVPPGTYALLVWTPGISFVIESPPNEPLQVAVEADKTTDLGIIELQSTASPTRDAGPSLGPYP